MANDLGPIVRITPWELHIRDPDFFETIYDGGKRDKVYDFVRWGNTDLSGLATIDHDHHKLRRAALSRYFSKAQISQFAPYIQTCADKLCERLQHEYSGKTVCLSDAYSCLSGDVVMQYCFARNDDFLGSSDFKSPILKATEKQITGYHIISQFPWILNLVLALPDMMCPEIVLLAVRFQRVSGESFSMPIFSDSKYRI